jgi:hypothetical protein
VTVRSLLCKRSLHVRMFLRAGVCVSCVCVRRETGRRGAGGRRSPGTGLGVGGLFGVRRRHGHGHVGSSLELLYPDRAFVILGDSVG